MVDRASPEIVTGSSKPSRPLPSRHSLTHQPWQLQVALFWISPRALWGSRWHSGPRGKTRHRVRAPWRSVTQSRQWQQRHYHLTQATNIHNHYRSHRLGSPRGVFFRSRRGGVSKLRSGDQVPKIKLLSCIVLPAKTVMAAWEDAKVQERAGWLLYFKVKSGANRVGSKGEGEGGGGVKGKEDGEGKSRGEVE